MPRDRPSIRPDADEDQVAGQVPARIMLPGNLAGAERLVRIAPERIRHIRQRRPEWFTFCVLHMPDVLADPIFVGQRRHGDRRRVEFVGLVGSPGQWLLVSVKFLDDVGEAWVNSAHPVSATYLTRRRRGGSMWRVRGS